MHRKYRARKRHLELEWQNVSRQDAYRIMRTFSTTEEYLTVTYWDILANRYITNNFYSGHRSFG